jgi:hypothetical protein
MNLRSCLPICTAILALFISSPAWANHVDRPASNHGTDDTCTSGNQNCQTFGTPFTASDGLSVTPYTFSDDGSVTLNYLDIFAVTGINPGTTVSFAFATLPADGQFGVFTCDNQGFGSITNPGVAVDASGNVALSTSCTGISATNSASDFLSNPGGPVTSWAFSSNGGVSTWWFYALATGPTSAGASIYLPTSVTVTGGTSTAPEPGTLLLLASGIAGLAVFRRRQARA